MSVEPAPARRPATWTAFGIISIVYAVLTVISGLAGQAMMGSARMPGDGGPTVDPIREAIDRSETYRVFAEIALPVGLVAALVLLVAGIGLLRARGWGRVLSLAYGWFSLATGVVTAVVTWIFISSPLLQRGMAATEDAERIVLVTAAVAGAIGSVVSLMYPLLLVIFLRKDARIEAGDPAAGKPAGERRG
jgi:hypothetical protein